MDDAMRRARASTNGRPATIRWLELAATGSDIKGLLGCWQVGQTPMPIATEVPVLADFAGRAARPDREAL
jgi:hypothetical protein